MRFSTLVAAIFGAVTTAAPIEEDKTAVVDLTQVPDAFAGTAWFSGGGSTYMSVAGCVRVPKIIQSFAVLKGSACYIYQNDGCSGNSVGGSGTADFDKLEGLSMLNYKCFNVFSSDSDIAAAIESSATIAARTPNEITTTDMELQSDEASVTAQGCGFVQLDDNTGIGYSMVTGSCYKYSRQISKYRINTGCTCFFYTEPCNMSKLWTGFSGGSRGSLDDRGMRGYVCRSSTLDTAVAPIVAAPVIEGRIESSVSKSPTVNATNLDLSSDDTSVTGIDTADVQDRKCGTMTIAYRHGQKMDLNANGNKCQNLHAYEVTDFEIYEGCTCSFFQSAACSWSFFWFGQNGPSHGSLQDRQINAWKCTIGPL